MSLDVVVVTHDSADHLAGALAGLPADARVVVVDNASLDGSVAIAERAGARVLANQVNAGFGAGANAGAALGDAELVLFLNPDARVDAAMVEALCDRLLADRSAAVVSPSLVHPDGRPQRVRWPFPSAGGAWREALGLHRVLPPPDDPGFVVGACFLVRRSAFDAVGGFDERIWLYGEETDLCRRLVSAGWRILLADDLVAEHVGGASGVGQAGLVFEHFERGGEHNVAIHDGPAALVSYRLANLTGAVARSWLPRRGGLHRRRAARLARVLLHRPASVAVDSPVTEAGDRPLVVCSLEAWDDVWRRNQFLVRELLRGDPTRRVLFVEPAFDPLHERRRGSGRRHRAGLRPVESDARIVRLEPTKWLPRAAGPFADRSLRRQVLRAAEELGLQAPTLWVNDPNYAGLATETGWPALYDITDDWTESGDGGRATERVRLSERRLFTECGSVVVCSEGLAASRREARPDLVLVPNAVDVEEFTRRRPRPVDLPPGPAAVYVGTLHEDRLDVDLVLAVASALPELQVVLVGPSSLSPASTGRLAAAPNLHLLGARPHDDVPGYLQHADVVIVPHVVSPFTESLDPIKAYECLAAGRPTVATPVAGFRGLPAPVVTASGPAFVDAVGTVVASGHRPSVPQAAAGWSERAAVFERALTAARVTPTVLRVVFVDHCAQLSGGELALVRLLPALQALDVEAHVVLGEHGPLEERLTATGASVEVLALDEGVAATRRDEVGGGLGLGRVVAAAGDVVTLRRRLRQIDPDLVHTNSLKAALYGGVAARLAGIPVVWHVRDRIADDYLPKPAVRLVRTLAWVLPSAIIANSAETRATIGRARHSGVIPSPVVSDGLVPVDHEPVDHEGFRVAMVGRLAAWKGQHVFLEAFATAFPDGDERAVLAGSAMFGEEAYENSLRQQVQRLGLVDRVDLLGFVDDVPAVLAGVDCLVHASVIAEPFGQVVVEGMAMGLPVIASAAGGPAEVITDGVDGLLCPPGDAAALAALLQRVASDPDERERIGRDARVRAGDFAPEVVAGKVRAVYDLVRTRR